MIACLLLLSFGCAALQFAARALRPPDDFYVEEVTRPYDEKTLAEIGEGWGAGK